LQNLRALQILFAVESGSQQEVSCQDGARAFEDLLRFRRIHLYNLKSQPLSLFIQSIARMVTFWGDTNQFDTLERTLAEYENDSVASICFTTKSLDSVSTPHLVFCLHHPARLISHSSEKAKLNYG
jgi:hypothetical protein